MRRVYGCAYTVTKRSWGKTLSGIRDNLRRGKTSAFREGCSSIGSVFTRCTATTTRNEKASRKSPFSLRDLVETTLRRGSVGSSGKVIRAGEISGAIKTDRKIARTRSQLAREGKSRCSENSFANGMNVRSEEFPWMPEELEKFVTSD